MKKKPQGNGAPSNGGRWFLTYSDMITLLMALFIMLYSMSNIDMEKYKNLSKGLHSAFGTTSGTGTGKGSGTGTGTGTGNSANGTAVVNLKPSSSGAASGKVTAVVAQDPSNEALTEVYKDLSSYVEKHDLKDEIELQDTGNYVQIHMKDVVLFEPNKADILASSKPILKVIENALSHVYDRIDHITISGHTADVVVDPTHSDELSWKLSTERAVTVLNELTKNGLKENKLSIQGYAHYDPIAPNDTDADRSKNRRVEITIFKNPSLGNGATGRNKTDLGKQASSAAAASSPSSAGSSSSAPTSSAAGK